MWEDKILFLLLQTPYQKWYCILSRSRAMNPKLRERKILLGHLGIFAHNSEGLQYKVILCSVRSLENIVILMQLNTTSNVKDILKENFSDFIWIVAILAKKKKNQCFYTVLTWEQQPLNLATKIGSYRAGSYGQNYIWQKMREVRIVYCSKVKSFVRNGGICWFYDGLPLQSCLQSQKRQNQLTTSSWMSHK